MAEGTELMNKMQRLQHTVVLTQLRLSTRTSTPENTSPGTDDQRTPRQEHMTNHIAT